MFLVPTNAVLIPQAEPIRGVSNTSNMISTLGKHVSEEELGSGRIINLMYRTLES